MTDDLLFSIWKSHFDFVASSGQRVRRLRLSYLAALLLMQQMEPDWFDGLLGRLIQRGIRVFEEEGLLNFRVEIYSAPDIDFSFE